MKKFAVQFYLPLFFLIVLGSDSIAQRGKDGARTVNSSVNVNEYTTLASNATSGSTTITVAASSLNSNGLFSGPLAPGDLIFIIQIQGATITSPNDSTYGAVAAYNNCGNNEFAQVSAVPNGTSISLDCGLINNYNSAGRTQVVRVPRWSTLTINNGGIVTCPTWNGSTGGVVAVEVLGNTVINSGGRIDVSGKGFRGGVLDNVSQFGTLDYRWNTAISGAEKGESIAGYQSDYDNLFGGRYDRGAPANGGGGGNGHTSGGGGGANAGNISNWNGYGIPDLSTGSWATAWNLEWTGFASNNSSGGGRGGYDYSSDDENALTTGPGNIAWGGDYRRNNGGLGGRPLDNTGGRLFFGGGGGSGDQNQNKGGGGGNGGGLIYMMSFADVSGGGQINANGSNGVSTQPRGTDGAGGAGGGGSIVVNTTGTISGVTVNANGGTGGYQIIRNVFEPTEAEGPGGGGGGGYISVTNGTPARNANGGANGTTDSGGLLEFTPNGATKGATGLPSQTFPSYYLTTNAGPTICSGSQANLSASIVGTAPPGITYFWYTVATGGTSIATGSTYTTPALFANATYYVEICPGFYRVPVQVTVDVVTTSFTATNACLGFSTTFTSTATSSQGTITTYDWDFGDASGSTSSNPTHTYAAANTYNVTLTVTDNLGCTAQVTIPVTIQAPPVPVFTANDTDGCAAFNVTFTNTTSGAGNTYLWDFGDGGNSSATNPSHSYGVGTFTVTLIATSANGCSDTTILTNYITVHPRPVPSFTATTVCLGDPTVFTNTSTGATNYAWDFGDGFFSGAANPTHIYAAAGSYTVLLTAANSFGCLSNTTNTVTVSNAPDASFTSTGPTTGCGSLTVNFVNNTTGGAGNAYSWNFGDGVGTSTQQDPTYTYTTPGTYTVTLLASLGSCSDVDSIVAYITVNPSPTAAFSATNVCLGDAMNFTNSSSGATGYTWDFGDGVGTSTSTNPSYTYTTANTYTVLLTVTNGTCTDTATLTVVVNNAPDVSFTSTGPTTGCGSLTVNFVNNTTGGAGNTYSWDFGDGVGTSTQQTPTYTYTTPGTYTVTLLASLGSCSDVDSIVAYITVNPSPTAAFSATNVCLGDAMNFTNSSSGAAGYTWDFGDGVGTSTSTNPSYTYTTANTYTVLLTATDGTCTDTATLIVVVNNAPDVSFTSTGPTTGCGSLTVNFVNNTTGGAGNTYSWDFGDGVGTSTQQDPTYTYTTPGTYTVTLLASLGSCSDVDSIVAYITVNPSPTAAFSATNVCLGDAMNFTNSSSGATGYTWDFGDGVGTSTSTNPSYTYTTANTYTVLLTATDGTCTDTATLIVVVNNAPDVSFTSTGPTTGCGSLTVNFVNNTTGGAGNAYSWDFGDGVGTSTQQTPTYTYTTPGTYTVTLLASLGSCSDVDSIVAYITVNPTPTSAFSATNVCLGDAMNFTNSSSGATGYTWDFGDGVGTSTSTNPSYTYTTANTYTVLLTVTNGTCTDTATLTVVVNNAPDVSFTSTGPTTGCGSLTVNFVNNTTGGAGNAYSWDFGDGVGTSTQQDPTYTYTTPGTYTVTLLASLGSCSDVDSIVAYITVNPTPTAAFSAGNVCLGDAMNFTNSSSGATGYTWDFGDGVGTSSSTNPSYTYTTANTYTVLLTVTNGACTDTATLIVVVNNAPDVSFTSTGPTTGCGSLTVNFVNNTTGGAGNTYSWDFGDGVGTSTQQDPSYTYTTPGTYTVILTATIGTCSDIDSIVNYITVTPGPVAGFAAGNACLGELINFTNNTMGATSYSWDFGDGVGTSSAINPTYTYFSPNTYTITLIASDGSCSDTITQTVIVTVAPTVTFSASPTTACDSLTVTFTNTTTGATSYFWEFGDGDTSILVNPVHLYNTPGIFSVTLIATDGSCSSTNTSANLIAIYETPQTTISASQTLICTNDCIAFTSVSTGNPTFWNWSFPGSTTLLSTLQNPPNICYPTAGVYSVLLTVSNGQCNSAQTLIDYITVSNCTGPVAGFYSSDTVLCKGSCVDFTSISLNATSYSWSFPGAIPSTSSAQNPTNICYPVTGSYDVTLIVSDGTQYDTLTITNFVQVAPAPPPPTMAQNGDTLFASAGTAYQWYFNSGPITGATNQQYIALASGNYYVSVTDSNGCESVSAQAWISLIGIEEENGGTLIYLYPNPASGYFTILIETKLKQSARITFTDVIGQAVWNEDISLMRSPFKKEFDISAVSPGIYFIMIDAGESRFVRKLIKD